MTREEERGHVARLAEVLKAKVRTDECGDPVILGRRGNVHADGEGWSLYARFRSNFGKNRFSQALALLGGILRQNAHAEGVWHLPCLPPPEGARIIRRALGIKKIVERSEETIKVQTERLRAFRASRPTPVGMQMRAEKRAN